MYCVHIKLKHRMHFDLNFVNDDSFYGVNDLHRTTSIILEHDNLSNDRHVKSERYHFILQNSTAKQYTTQQMA